MHILFEHVRGKKALTAYGKNLPPGWVEWRDNAPDFGRERGIEPPVPFSEATFEFGSGSGDVYLRDQVKDFLSGSLVERVIVSPFYYFEELLALGFEAWGGRLRATRVQVLRSGVPSLIKALAVLEVAEARKALQVAEAELAQLG